MKMFKTVVTEFTVLLVPMSSCVLVRQPSAAFATILHLGSVTCLNKHCPALARTFPHKAEARLRPL